MTEGHDPLVDRDAFAHSLGELRRALPDAGGLFATLQRVIDATWAVFQMDGASLALEHEDGCCAGWWLPTVPPAAGGRPA